MKRHYAWVIAFTGTLVLLLSHGFGRMSYSVILPSMREGLGLNYYQVGLIGTGNFIGYVCLAVIGGFLAARFGARKLIFVSIMVMGVSLFLTGLTRSFIGAFFWRLITGIGTGGSYIPMMALPSAWFATGKRGLATGINTIGTGLGFSISGLALPYLILHYGENGWRYSWFMMGIIAFAAAFVCYGLLRDRPSEKGCCMYGSNGTERADDSTSERTFLSTFRAVAVEKEIWKLGCVYFMYGFSYIIYLTFFVAFMIKEVGIPPQKAGGIFAITGFLCIFSGTLWGSISDLVGRRYGSMLGYITLALSYILPALSGSHYSLYVSASLFGITMSAIPVIMAAASGDAVGGRLAPAGLGVATLFFGIGQAIGPAVAGWIKDATGTFSYAFALSAGVSSLGALLSLCLRKKGNRGHR